LWVLDARSFALQICTVKYCTTLSYGRFFSAKEREKHVAVWTVEGIVIHRGRRGVERKKRGIICRYGAIASQWRRLLRAA